MKSVFDELGIGKEMKFSDKEPCTTIHVYVDQSGKSSEVVLNYNPTWKESVTVDLSVKECRKLIDLLQLKLAECETIIANSKTDEDE